MKRSRLGLFCFSPAVMLGTFLIELGLLTYVVFRYKLNSIGRLAVAILLFLAAFQLAEYNVCEGAWIDPPTASRLGFVAITILPPLGLHMVMTIGKYRNSVLLGVAYATCAAFIAYFLLASQTLSGHECLGNYVIFQITAGIEWLYSLYYYGWMFVGMWLCWRLAQGKKVAMKQALYGFGAGYLSFIVPTTAANIIDTTTMSAIPSVMCGFAVLFAVVLVVWVMPRVGSRR